MLSYFLLLNIAIESIMPTHALHGLQVQERCNLVHSFQRYDVTLPSPQWPQTMLKVVTKDSSSALFKPCTNSLICPESLTCEWDTMLCYTTTPDWVTHIEIHCPQPKSCLEYCFVSFVIHGEVIVQEAIICLSSIFIFVLTTWSMFTELFKEKHMAEGNDMVNAK